MNLIELRKRLHGSATKERAEVSQRFFKTGPGEYGEGDKFIGVTVPALRKLSREFRDLPLEKVSQVLRSEIHEERLLALFILIHQYNRGGNTQQKRIYDLYLDHTTFINNWDLVDASAEFIVGPYLFDRSRKPLYCLAKSQSLWERRIAIMATFHFIKEGDFDETLKIARLLLNDEEDLIHKAVGWMLREIGNRAIKVEEAFLREHCRSMPRTMLRYAIEKFPEAKRQRYLKGKI